MAKKKRSIDEKLRNNRIKQEFVGITIVGLAVFVLLSLLSYSHLDPSFRHYVAQAEVINNIFGTVGSHSADALFFIFGFTSYLIPLILLFWASKQLLQVQDYNGAVFFFGVGGLLFSLQVLLALSIPQVIFTEQASPREVLLEILRLAYLFLT
ncbi:MAG: DNA translocase FtsK 4TM domain-containing protein [Deltaproteobacteria bacterium]